MAAPNDSPRAKKKVMRAPAVSPSLAGTSLLESGERGEGE